MLLGCCRATAPVEDVADQTSAGNDGEDDDNDGGRGQLLDVGLGFGRRRRVISMVQASTTQPCVYNNYLALLVVLAARHVI